MKRAGVHCCRFSFLDGNYLARERVDPCEEADVLAVHFWFCELAISRGSVTWFSRDKRWWKNLAITKEGVK